jgi:hypothetical protein
MVRKEKADQREEGEKKIGKVPPSVKYWQFIWQVGFPR